MDALITCEVHPLHDLRELPALRIDLGASEERVSWIARWGDAGFAALEESVAILGSTFAYGGAPSFADCYLMPKIYNAERYEVDLSPYPRLRACGARVNAHAAFAAARPALHPDADPA